MLTTLIEKVVYNVCGESLYPFLNTKIALEPKPNFGLLTLTTFLYKGS